MQNNLDSTKILADEIEEEPILDFGRYSDAIIKMIRSSTPGFSIGIFGEWGTGKTTLMRLIEKKLRQNIIRMDEIPGKDMDNLLRFLNETVKVTWVKKGEIEIIKEKDRIKISKKDTKQEVSLEFSVPALEESSSARIKKLKILAKGALKRTVPALEESSSEYFKQKMIMRIEGKKYEQTYDAFKPKDNYYPVVYLRDFKEDCILTVWFNAWRYEREEHYALIALMKTIAFTIGDHPIYRNIKPVLLRGLEIIAKGVIHKLATQYLIADTEYDEFQKKLSAKMELYSEFERNTIYFDGVNRIEKELKKINIDYKNNSKIVIFIDDLDRCSSETVLEVFESIKVLLGIEGFIYVLGLSDQKVSQLINLQYKKLGILDKNDTMRLGEQYLNKIIQIPINIQAWDTSDVYTLIEHLSQKLDAKYSRIISDNKDLVAFAAEHNPRQLKRFINYYITISEIFAGNPSIKEEQLLFVQALRHGWNEFYLIISTDDEFRDIIFELADLGSYERHLILQGKNDFRQNLGSPTGQYPTTELTEDFNGLSDSSKQIINSITDDLWALLKKERNVNKAISWEVYRRATTTVKTGITDTSSSADPFQSKSTFALFQDAKNLVFNQRYRAALKILNHLIEKTPNNSEYLNLKVFSLIYLNKLNEAFEIADESLDKDPNYSWAWYNKGVIYDRLGFMADNPDQKKKNFKLAAECYGKVLILDPKYFQAYIGLGWDHIYLNDYENALDIFQRSLVLSPKNSPALNGIGMCFFYLNKKDEALEKFNEVLANDPKFYIAWYNRGMVYQTLAGQQGNIELFRKAKRDFEEALRIEPKYAEALNSKLWIDNNYPGL